jgi:hypothetical protein
MTLGRICWRFWMAGKRSPADGKMITFMNLFYFVSSWFGCSYLARTDLLFHIWVAESCFGSNSLELLRNT